MKLAPQDRDFCRHCNVKLVNRARGLCWGCYYRPGVREQYPPTDPRAIHGLAVSTAEARLPFPQPTKHLPGTPEKWAVLAERAERGERLWHPDDAAHGD